MCEQSRPKLAAVQSQPAMGEQTALLLDLELMAGDRSADVADGGELHAGGEHGGPLGGVHAIDGAEADGARVDQGVAVLVQVAGDAAVGVEDDGAGRRTRLLTHRGFLSVPAPGCSPHRRALVWTAQTIQTNPCTVKGDPVQ
jgi:hypothetical protein